MKKILLMAGFVVLLINGGCTFFGSPNDMSSQRWEETITYDPRIPLFEDYAVPWNVFSEKKELLLTATVAGNQVTAQIGSGDFSQQIYAEGYYWDNEAWQPFSLDGMNKGADKWFRGSATGEFPVSTGTSEIYFLGYVCHSVGGVFKCGCREAFCLENGRWQIQGMRVVPVTHSPTISSPWVMGYYPGYEQVLLPPEEIDFSLLTHIAFAFLQINADGSLNTDFLKKEGEGQLLAQDIANRAHAAGIKALLSVGGVNSSDSYLGALQSPNREFFIDNLLRVMREFGYDGLDLDVEPMIDIKEMTALAQDLRAKHPGIILTVPVTFLQNQTQEELVEYSNLARQLDRINVMSYDMSGVWPGWYSWHHSAMKGATRFTPSSVEASVAGYVKAGIPREKLGIGIPSYGYCWRGPTGPRQPLGDNAVRDEIHLTYLDIQNDYYAPFAERWDVFAEVPYLTFSQGSGPLECNFISYDNYYSVLKKGSFIRDEGLGGVIIWTLGQAYDPSRGSPLIEAVVQGISR